jgi:hypothetical protein
MDPVPDDQGEVSIEFIEAVHSPSLESRKNNLTVGRNVGIPKSKSFDQRFSIVEPHRADKCEFFVIGGQWEIPFPILDTGSVVGKGHFYIVVSELKKTVRPSPPKLIVGCS